MRERRSRGGGGQREQRPIERVPSRRAYPARLHDRPRDEEQEHQDFQEPAAERQSEDGVGQADDGTERGEDEECVQRPDE